MTTAQHSTPPAHQPTPEAAVVELETLQDLEDAGWHPEHLESRGAFDRYCLADSTTFWVCPECDSIEADPIEGCEHCGYGAGPCH